MACPARVLLRSMLPPGDKRASAEWRPGDFLAVQALGSMDRIEERSTGRVQECLDAAAHCEKRAASATDRTVQATFAEAAHCWRELARCWRECQSNAPTAEKVRA